MSSFTTQVRFICETLAHRDESAGGDDVNTIINLASPRIFNFNYPIFDENYRSELNHKILRHFYTREIGYETYGLWKLKLEDKLNLVMPYYNKLYESALIDFNPLYDVDYRTEGNKQKEKTNVNSGSADETTNKNVSGSSTEKIDKNNVNSKDVNESETSANIINTSKENNNVETNSNDFVGSDTGSNTRNRNNSKNGVNTGSQDDVEDISKNQWDLYSDTPQSGVYGLTNFGDPGGAGGSSISNNSYLTNARRNTDDEHNTKNRNTSEVTSENGEEQEQGTNNISYDYKTNISNVQNNDSKETEEGSGSKNKNTSGSTIDVGSSNRESSDDKTTDEIKHGNSTSVGNETGNEDYTQRIYGKRGSYSYSKMIEDFRKTFLNIDLMVMKELEPLFMGLWEL